MNHAITITNKITVIAAALVILAAAILSFTALRDLFIQIGLFAAWLGLLFPLLFDLAEVAAAVGVMNAKLNGDDARFEWRMVLFFTALGVIANAGHAWHAWHVTRIDGAQFLLAVAATSLFPLSIALVTHLVKRSIERHLRRHEIVTTLAQMRTECDALVTQRAQLMTEIERLRARKDAQNDDMHAAMRDVNDARRAQVEERRAQLVTLLDNDEMSTHELATHFGVSASTIRRDVKALNGKVS